jgi:hypothetical protein
MFVKKVIIYDSRKPLSKKIKGVDFKEEIIYSIFGLIFYRVFLL